MNTYLIAEDFNFAVDTQDYELRFPAPLMGNYWWVRAQMDPQNNSAWGSAVVIVEGQVHHGAKWLEISSSYRFTTGSEVMVGPIDVTGFWNVRMRASTKSGTSGLRYSAFMLATGGES